MATARALLVPLLRGARLRCPACGRGRMGRGLFDVAAECAECGASFEPSRGEWTGALMFGQGFFGLVALGGWFVLRVLLEAPHSMALAWGLAWAVFVPLLFYRNWKGLWVGAMYAFDPSLRA